MKNESKIISLIERHKESRLTVSDFCSNEGIGKSTFYNWKKKLRESNHKRFIPLVVNTPGSLANNQNIIQEEAGSIKPTQGDYLLEISYPNGSILRIKKDLDLTQLKALINLLA